MQDWMSGLCGRLRALVHDCLQKQLHHASVFYADKLVTFSHGIPSDVLLLAQAYISSKQYRRALQVLKKDELIETDQSFRYFAAVCLLHCQQWDECLALVGEDVDAQAMGRASTLNNQDVLTTGCQVSVASALHLLRAKAYDGLNNRLRAKESYQAALKTDPYCYDALMALFEGHMLTCDEETSLLKGLQLHPQDQWLALLYRAQGKKYGLNPDMDMILNTLDTVCDVACDVTPAAHEDRAAAGDQEWSARQPAATPAAPGLSLRQEDIAGDGGGGAAAQRQAATEAQTTPLLLKSVPLSSNRAQQQQPAAGLSPVAGKAAGVGKAGVGHTDDKGGGGGGGVQHNDSDITAASTDQEAARQVPSWSTYLTHLTSGVITPSHIQQPDAVMVTPMSENGCSITDMDADTPGYDIPPTIVQHVAPQLPASPPAPIRFSLPVTDTAPHQHATPTLPGLSGVDVGDARHRPAHILDQQPRGEAQQQQRGPAQGQQVDQPSQPAQQPSATCRQDMGRAGGVAATRVAAGGGQAGGAGHVSSTVQQYQVVSGGLQGNVDVQACRADWLYHRGMYEACYDLTSQVLRCDAYALQVLPLHVACCCILNKQAELFQLGHRLTEQFPDKALSWYAVGCYYMCSRQLDQARRHLCKATALQGGFAPAWVAYGHAFSALDERDQAMAAYRMAFRLFPGLHLPLLGMGMEYAAMNNLQLAERMLLAAHELCPSDPATCHELGCVCARNGLQPAACAWLRHALKLAVLQHSGSTVQQVEAGDQEVISGLGPRWEPTMVALAHSLRKQGQVEEAVQWYRLALRVVPSHPGTMAALGLCLQMQGNAKEAVEKYHAAMAQRPDDQLVASLLNTALMEYTAQDDGLAGGA